MVSRGCILKLARGIHPSCALLQHADNVVQAIGRLRSGRSGLLGQLPASSSVRGTPVAAAARHTTSSSASRSDAAEPASSAQGPSAAAPSSSAAQALLARIRAKRNV